MPCQNTQMSWLSRKFVAALLLLTIALTVMSPHFAWEASAADAHHDETGAMVLCNVDETSSCGSSSTDHHDNHACGGHMFSHLPAQASKSHIPSVAATADKFDSLAESGYLSRTPDSLERPPRATLA